MKYKIYCDMDGVLTDFNKAYLDLTGIDISDSYRSDPTFWKPIDEAGYDFWININWLPDGKEFWSYIKKYKPTLLSSPSEKIESRIGKVDWVERELPGIKLILRSSSHKKDFATPNSILIDDRETNIEGWISKGGVGILHKNAKDSIKQLKELGL